MKHLIVVAGASTGGKTSHVDATCELLGRSSRESFAAFLKDEAIKRGWSGRKDKQGRLFLQRLQRELKDRYGEDIFARKMLEQAALSYKDLRSNFVFVDDHRFSIERLTLNAAVNVEKKLGDTKLTYVKFFDPIAEALWEKAFNAGEEWAHHPSELEWRAFPDSAWDVIYHNDRTCGLDYSVSQFFDSINRFAEIKTKRGSK